MATTAEGLHNRRASTPKSMPRSSSRDMISDTASGKLLIACNMIAVCGMVPVRTDITPPYPELARRNIRAARVEPSLLANLDSMNRSRLLQQWKSAILADE